MSVKVGVVNESTVVSTADVTRIAAAVAVQVHRDFAPRWYRTTAHVTAYASLGAAPLDAWLIAVLDNADQAGALGYHDETPDGRPYSRVFAKTVLDNHGTVLAGANSVSVTLSHETLELLADPNVNLWADDGGTHELAVEVGDPVENTSYDINGVAVSNFVLQSYFDVQSKATIFDFLGQLRAPWTMLPGGYQILRAGGRVTQKFGDEVPQWKLDTKTFPAARSARRAA